LNIAEYFSRFNS